MKLLSMIRQILTPPQLDRYSLNVLNEVYPSSQFKLPFLNFILSGKPQHSQSFKFCYFVALCWYRISIACVTIRICMSVIAAMSRDRFFLYLYWHQNHSFESAFHNVQKKRTRKKKAKKLYTSDISYELFAMNTY